VLGAADVLPAQEQHAVAQQHARISANRAVVVHGIGEAHAAQLAPMLQVSCSTRMMSPSSDHEDRRTGGLARLEVAMRLHRVLKGVVLVDLDTDAPGGDVAEDLVRQRGFSAGRDIVASAGRVRRASPSSPAAAGRTAEWCRGGAHADHQPRRRSESSEAMKVCGPRVETPRRRHTAVSSRTRLATSSWL